MSTKSKVATLAHQLIMKLMLAFAILEKVLPAGVKGLPALTGLSARNYTEPQVIVLHRVSEILKNSLRVFRFQNGVFLEVRQIHGDGLRLVPLLAGGEMVPSAAALLSNLFEIKHKDTIIPIPYWFANQVLHSEQVRASLLAINHYARRPVFDQDFNLCSPGWNPTSGTLIHGQDVEPDLTDYSQQGVAGVDRLPPYLRQLLSRFCFRTPADLANFLAAMLTGLLVNHFEVEQKAMWIVDGNQPGLGKSLLVRLLGVVIDGVDPTMVPYTPYDEELAKRVGADVRQYRQSLVSIDNAKLSNGKEVSSPFLEANAVAPVLSFRILGHSENHVQKNSLLWFLTMNNTKASRDLLSRSAVVQLHHDGDPAARDFAGFDPIRYALQHRFQILGELAGLVIRWNQQGRPLGHQQHRLHEWAKVIGGILQVAGFPDFLANANQVASSFSIEHEQLAKLAEAAVRHSLQVPKSELTTPFSITFKLTPTEWCPLFNSIGLLEEELRGKDTRTKASRIGQFFSSYLGREVEFEVDGFAGKATLRREDVRSNQKKYYFDLTWEPVQASPSVGQEAAPPAIVQTTPPPCDQQGGSGAAG